MSCKHPKEACTPYRNGFLTCELCGDLVEALKKESDDAVTTEKPSELLPPRR